MRTNQPTPPKHIGDMICFQRQKFEWGDFPFEKEFRFEIISWAKMTYHLFKATWYCSFVAKLYSDISKNGVIQAENDDLVILDIPYKTFMRMIDKTPMSVKRDIPRAGCDNVLVCIRKTAKTSFEISEMEVLRADEGLALSADKIFYSLEGKR